MFKFEVKIANFTCRDLHLYGANFIFVKFNVTYL